MFDLDPTIPLDMINKNKTNSGFDNVNEVNEVNDELRLTFPYK